MINFEGVYKNSAPIIVRMGDLDFLGHVTNPVYQVYFLEGFVSYIHYVLGVEKLTPDPNWVMVTNTIEYLTPIFLTSSVKVVTRGAALGKKSFKLQQQIVNLASGEIHARCTCTLVCFSGSAQRSISIPEEWRQKIVAHDNGVELT